MFDQLAEKITLGSIILLGAELNADDLRELFDEDECECAVISGFGVLEHGG